MTNQLQLPTVPVAPAITDVSGLVEEANRLLVTTVTIQAYDPVRDESFSWVVAPEQWSLWLTPVVDTQAANQFDWALDEQQAQAFLNGQTQTLGDSRFIDTAGLVTALTEAITTQETAVTMRVYHHPRQHIVQAGDTFASIGRAYGMPYPWIQHANPGVSDGLFIGQALTIPSPDELLPLPIVANKRLIVSISQQKMWAYENGSLLWEWLASTGIAESPTSPGVFQIQTHETNAYAGNWDLWMPYFMGIYQPVPTSDFMNGFHGFPTRDVQNLLWTSSLGHQVTYGCVLVSTENAQHLFNWAEPGVVVEIRP
jgi:LysM repeat protein